jgi:hypothetical protein
VKRKAENQDEGRELLSMSEKRYRMSPHTVDRSSYLWQMRT